ncbi:putative 15-O-acetyltransferase Tri3 [Favolaschia claudopus]|uniref:15-O-acetyltransferase Tri3 n=1 Tax=Favolaschia claudopus TaxID=2862362 RepID=A0AAW0EHL8_9AGAR
MERVNSYSSDDSDDTLVDSSRRRLERQLGQTEASYFLPSRESGVNDMYLHLGFQAPPAIMKRSRVCLVWAILRLKHPLLASKVKMYDYEDIRFVYLVPESVSEVLDFADACLEYRSQSKDVMIDQYLNGPRTLSNEHLSHLVVSQPSEDDTADSTCDVQNYDLLLCATHFLGDGMALHNFANDFFALLASDRVDEDLELLLTEEWYSKCGAEKKLGNSFELPRSLEERFPPMADGKFRRAARRVDFENSQSKLIGGHHFPRRSGNRRRTVVPTVSFDSERTKSMLKKCKTHSVSISAALFSIMNVAWAKTCDSHWELPIMMYSALNLRPVLTAGPSFNDSYWYLAIGYFNVVLPSFIPQSKEDMEKVFWHRARSAKDQSTAAARSPMLVPRSFEMACKRGKQARAWAREDDEKERGTWKAPQPAPVSTTNANKPPSVALIGLSLLGNLDGIYKHSTFSKIQLHTLTTGSRQRAGGMLLFGYTFAGKLWISLGYDEESFDDRVQHFWENVLLAVDTFLG